MPQVLSPHAKVLSVRSVAQDDSPAVKGLVGDDHILCSPKAFNPLTGVHQLLNSRMHDGADRVKQTISVHHITLVSSRSKHCHAERELHITALECHKGFEVTSSLLTSHVHQTIP